MTWEPDDLIDTFDAAEDHRQEQAEIAHNAKISTAERERMMRLESLRMSLSRTQQQLKQATNPAYIQTLERASAALSIQIDELKKPDANKP